MPNEQSGSVQLRELTGYLKSLKDRSGLSYRQMSEQNLLTPRSSATWSRADSGQRLPTLGIVEGYAEACGASTAEVRKAQRLWDAAANAGSGAGAGGASPRCEDTSYAACASVVDLVLSAAS